jgi:shikimate kinase
VTDRVLLVGMMGAGKSTVGRLLAERLGWRHVDTDEVVEATTGRTVAQLFAERGEPTFRALESAALAGLLADDVPAVAGGAVAVPSEAGGGAVPAVVAVAGGAVLDPANRALLRRSGTVVWLRATPATLGARVGAGTGRPLLAGGTPGEELARIDAVRRPLYEEVATVVVDVDGLAPVVVADKIVAVLP